MFNFKLNNTTCYVNSVQGIISKLSNESNRLKEIFILDSYLSDKFIHSNFAKFFFKVNPRITLHTIHLIYKPVISISWGWELSQPQNLNNEIWHWVDAKRPIIEFKIAVLKDMFPILKIKFEIISIFAQDTTVTVNINGKYQELSFIKKIEYSCELINKYGEIDIRVECKSSPIVVSGDSRQLSIGVKNLLITDCDGNHIHDNYNYLQIKEKSEKYYRKTLHDLNFYYVSSYIDNEFRANQVETCGSLMSGGVYFTKNSNAFIDDLSGSKRSIKFFKSSNA